MSEIEQISQSNLSEGEKENYYNQEILNIEFLEYHAQKLNDVYRFKDYIMYFPSVQKQMISMQKWKIIRNICIIIIYVSILFTKPYWCDQQELNLSKNCSVNKIEDIQYYTIMPRYLNLYTFEIISWLLILILIVYDLFLVEVKPKMILFFCLLYVSDIIIGFLYMNGVIQVKFNLIIRIIFAICYPVYTRMIAYIFCIFLFKIRKLLFLYFSMIVFIGMILFIIYFDTVIPKSDLVYNSIKFNNLYEAVYSSYTIITQQNIMEIFTIALKLNPYFLMVLIPVYYCSLFLIHSFIIALMAYFYCKVVRREMFKLEYYKEFRKIIYYFRSNKGIVDYQKLSKFMIEFFKDPKKIDFKKYEQKLKDDKRQQKLERKQLKKQLINSINHQQLQEIRSMFFYWVIKLIIDVIIAISPILILNVNIQQLNGRWYYLVTFMATCSCLDPYLMLECSQHKLSNARRIFVKFELSTTAMIIVSSLIMPMQRRKDQQTLEQSNDMLFIIFSILCFTKLTSIVDDLILKSPLFHKIIYLCKQLIPFFIKIFMVYFLLTLVYAAIGNLMYGGRINSNSIMDYEHTMGIKIRHNYQFLNFNDFINSFMTLFILMLKNNWIYISEQMFFVQNEKLTSFYLISYITLSNFVCIGLIFGLISRLIIQYFEKKFSQNTNFFENFNVNEFVSRQNIMDEEDDF